jgi:UDP-glucose 4-epimerase
MIIDLESISGKKVTVTGASGYIGSSLVKVLHSFNCEITRVSRKSLQRIDGIRDIKSDILNQRLWSDIVDTSEVIFHLAGNTSNGIATKDPVTNLKTTVESVKYLLSANAKKKSPARIVYASTATVYGLTNNLPVSEIEPTKPISVYDEHKVLAENEILSYSKDSKSSNVILRLANVYGFSSIKSGSHERGILNQVCGRAIAGKTIELFGDGNYIRDYIHLDDVVRAFTLGGTSEIHGCETINVGSGNGLTLREAFEKIVTNVESLTGRKSEIMFVPFPKIANQIDQRNFVANISRGAQTLGWRPEISFEIGINQMIIGLINEFTSKNQVI